MLHRFGVSGLQGSLHSLNEATHMTYILRCHMIMQHCFVSTDNTERQPAVATYVKVFARRGGSRAAVFHKDGCVQCVHLDDASVQSLPPPQVEGPVPARCASSNSIQMFALQIHGCAGNVRLCQHDQRQTIDHCWWQHRSLCYPGDTPTLGCCH